METEMQSSPSSPSEPPSFARTSAPSASPSVHKLESSSFSGLGTEAVKIAETGLSATERGRHVISKTEVLSGEAFVLLSLIAALELPTHPVSKLSCHTATFIMPSSAPTIKDIIVTPVAFHDPPLLNAVGVHEPFALRSIIEVVTDREENGKAIYGLGESYGDATHISRLQRAAERIKKSSIYDTNGIFRACAEVMGEDTSTGGDGMAGLVTTASATDKVFAAFEVACLDIQGKLAGVPVCDLLGGKVRDIVQYSAYLFYKWARHPGRDEEDEFGEALDPDSLVKQAKKMIDEYDFKAIKLKGGVFSPQQEVDAIKALREAYPNLPLRLDPNAAWSVETSKWVGKELEGIIEYLEDPADQIEGMAAVGKAVSMPLATNMAVVAFNHLPESIAQDAVQVVLSDHHFWGGLRKSQHLASICAVWNMRLSMHSNSHLGISLAAMTHLASATPNLDYACDTHWPWKRRDEDVVIDGALKWQKGGVVVPTAPGLGVELDRDRLAALHEQYKACGLTKRDDTTYMRKFQPGFSAAVPRF
ncbi:uncharacterized protein LTR77_000548 [Saxophila tyrrhenica]|uniref:glucarate dehydratase n=1 Tax=Saxophila tyrrhenica TaxID=1690608 RepID=A0AAV9PNB7_9PEZI|nr:hypothetical protein LTR77_000548 [Saxophila tyrrhenica]